MSMHMSLKNNDQQNIIVKFQFPNMRLGSSQSTFPESISRTEIILNSYNIELFLEFRLFMLTFHSFLPRVLSHILFLSYYPALPQGPELFNRVNSKCLRHSFF